MWKAPLIILALVAAAPSAPALQAAPGDGHGSYAALAPLPASRAVAHPDPRPPRPWGGLRVRPGEDLQALIRSSASGSALCLDPGTYDGPVLIDKPLTLWGPREAVVRSDGKGSTLSVRAPGVSLLGFTVDGSGHRFDQMDSAVFIHADDVRVEGLLIRHALFGVAVEESHRVRVVANDIYGTEEPELGLRGDAIRFWETRESLISGNAIHNSRDVVVWYSPGNRVVDNYSEFGRYGTHFMYSSDNVAEGNRYVGNLVGIFIMYCRNVSVRGNLMAQADPTGGMGLGVKESGNLTVEHNSFVRNQAGVYLDTSPLQIGDANRFDHNLFAFCGAGVEFHSSESRNSFLDNTFQGNEWPARVEGGGDALKVVWKGNYFDDYQGYDMDRDGVGDVPYEQRSFSGQATAAHPDLAFFKGTPAMGLLDAMSHIFPFLSPRSIFVDDSPRMAADALAGLPHAR